LSIPAYSWAGFYAGGRDIATKATAGAVAVAVAEASALKIFLAFVPGIVYINNRGMKGEERVD
jgi:hypothetical protein